MPNDDQPKTQDIFAHVPQAFADREFPVVVVDLVTSIFNTGGMIRICLARGEPEMFGRPVDMQRPPMTPMLQLAMPVGGFIGAALFMESQARKLVADGGFPKELFEQMKAQVVAAEGGG